MSVRKQRRKVITAGRYGRAIQYSMRASPDLTRTRAPKRLISSCAREAINLRHSWQKFKAVLAANFKSSDLVVTLTYSDDALPSRRKEAEDKLKLFIRKLRTERRAHEQILKYMYVTERGHSSGRLHHHIIINSTSSDYIVIRKLWAKYGDNIELDKISRKGYDGWADYLTKEPRESGRRYVGERMWRSSRNLVKPESVSGWVDIGTPLEAPLGSYILDRQRRDNCYGSFEYIEYIMPAKVKTDPST